jgi:hypothetical protein
MSANASPIFTLFDTEIVDELRADHILRLAAGVLGAVQVTGFGSPELCAQVMRALDDHPLGQYDERIVYPPVAKLGPAAYDFYGAYQLTEEYWQAAMEAAEVRSTLLAGADPLEFVIDRIRTAWDGPVIPATANGRPLFAGMVRETTSGMRMHFDEIVRELPGALDAPPVCQLAFNWYLSMPEGGGDTLVYKRRWVPADEEYRDGYGWAEETVADVPVAAARAQAGDAIIFDPRNYHAVQANSGAGRRVSLSFFLGVPGGGQLIYWS